MNKAYDYNGTLIAPSRPVQKLMRRSRILHIDSGDRDNLLYPNNGSFTIYLPRAYERVVGINIKDAEFPALSVAKVWDVAYTGGTRNSQPASYTGSNLPPANFISTAATDPHYFFLEIQGLNMSDETSPAAERSASTNSIFAKFVSDVLTQQVLYNESSSAHQDIEFYPALTRLDRLQMRLRTHKMNHNQHVFWLGSEWSITLEIQTLENAFDEFSTIESRVGDRS